MGHVNQWCSSCRERRLWGKMGEWSVPDRCRSFWGERIHVINSNFTQACPLFPKSLTDGWRVACKGLILLIFGHLSHPNPNLQGLYLQFGCLVSLILARTCNGTKSIAFHLWSQTLNLSHSVGQVPNPSLSCFCRCCWGFFGFFTFISVYNSIEYNTVPLNHCSTVPKPLMILLSLVSLLGFIMETWARGFLCSSALRHPSNNENQKPSVFGTHAHLVSTFYMEVHPRESWYLPKKPVFCCLVFWRYLVRTEYKTSWNKHLNWSFSTFWGCLWAIRAA